MCLATPMELVRIDKKGFGYLEHKGKEYQVNLTLIEDPQVGDWLLAHADLAVSRITSQEAQTILELIAKSES